MNCPECNVQMERTEKFRCPGCGAEFDRSDDWISVKVRLPKKGTQVLSTDSVDYCIDWYDICGFKINDKGQCTDEPNLTWYSEEYGWMPLMPLPEPPKEDE